MSRPQLQYGLSPKLTCLTMLLRAAGSFNDGPAVGESSSIVNSTSCVKVGKQPNWSWPILDLLVQLFLQGRSCYAAPAGSLLRGSRGDQDRKS